MLLPTSLDPIPSFVCLPRSIEQVLSGVSVEGALGSALFPWQSRSPRKVYCLLLDGFGWHLLHENKSRFRVLRELLEQGELTKLLSQFPSSTTCHLTSMHTGLSVGEHGIIDWHYYEPQVDAVISPLLFSHADKSGRETLSNITPQDLLPFETIYERLAKRNIPSVVIQSSEFTPSPFVSTLTSGATLLAHDSVAHGFELLKQSSSESDVGYFYLYHELADTICHKFGSSSDEYHEVLQEYFKLLESFVSGLKGSGDLLILTADHGHKSINTERVLYLDNMLPELAALLTHCAGNGVVCPEGYTRNLFLRCSPEHEEKVIHLVSGALQGDAEIYRTNELVEQGVWGETVGRRFLERVGNLVVVPDDDCCVWWSGDGRFENSHVSHHGGVSKEERETFCLAVEL